MINVIKNTKVLTNKIDSILKNYFENYLESNIHIYHQDYIYQLVWNNKINNNEYYTIFKDCITNTVIQKRQYIRYIIKKDKFDLSSLYNLILGLNNKIIKLENYLNIKNNISINYLKIILHDQILITFLEKNLCNLDDETINSIKKINKILKITSNDNHIWFLKLIGLVLKNNIKPLNIYITEKYKNLYEFINLIEYSNLIIKMYNFTGKSLNILSDPISELLEEKLIICIKLCNIFELLNLVDYSSKIIKNKLKNKKIILKTISHSFNNFIANINNLNNNEKNHLLFLIIKCKELDLLENYILLIFDNNKFINNVHDIIHNNINISPFEIKKLFSFIKLKDKDIFIEKYHKLLIKRILSNQTKIKNEKLIYTELINIFPLKITKKIGKVIIDYETSQSDNNTYKQKLNINNFTTITTSYSNWDINYNQGYITFNENEKINEYNNLEYYLINYQNCYDKIYENKRKLLWLLQYGEIEIIYINIEIKLLPIQLLILELFNINNEIKIDQINEQIFLNNYSNKFKNDIINSLIIGNILIKKNNNILVLNKNTNTITKNLIETYLLNNEIKVFNNMKYEIAHDREDIIKSLINHYIKINSINKVELYDKIYKKINIFQLNEELYNKSLDNMIKMDYISIENNIVNKIKY